MSNDAQLTTGAMARAVELGHAARSRTAPNPWVGCVIVRDGVVVGEGASEPPGGAHAEVGALGAAGDRARGATAYVTLEPCAHQGRTGPCVDALVGAGVARVVVACQDPDPRVAGRGLEALRHAGIVTEVGLLGDAAAESLRPYLHQRRTGRAWCIVKTATSLDGRTAAADGSSQWITDEDARADAHRLRAESQAVVVGAGTALADRPRLTARGVEVARPPLRVLLDAVGRVPTDGPLFDPTLAPTLVVTTAAVAPGASDAWRAAGAKVETVAAAPSGVDLGETLALLAREGVLQALVEGGAVLHGSFLAVGLADRVVTYVGGVVLGPDAVPAFAGPGPDTLAAARRFRLVRAATFDAGVRLDWEPR